MAERSKAPDSRAQLFVLTERSGPRMWAWVRIPLLTKTFFLSFENVSPLLYYASFEIPQISEIELTQFQTMREFLI